MVDTDTLRKDAFQYITTLPEFSRNVLDMIEDLDAARLKIILLESTIDDDGRIITGLLEHYRVLEKCTAIAFRYMHGAATQTEFEEAYKAAQQIIIA